MILIPSMDLRGGGCVRLLQGDFAAERRYDDTPRELLRRYERAGANWFHVVDLDGARDGALAHRELIGALAQEARLSMQVGGGVRDEQALQDLLARGIARVVVGSIAVESPELVRAWLERYGAERICVAFDVRADEAGRPCVRTRGWTESTRLTLWDALSAYEGTPLRHVLCTDIARDGMMSGPSLALYAEARSRHPAIEWQASGGLRSLADLQELERIGVAGAISGRALLEDHQLLREARPYLPNA